MTDTGDEYDEDNILYMDNEGDLEDDNEDVEENILPENLKRNNPSSMGFPSVNERSLPSASYALTVRILK